MRVVLVTSLGRGGPLEQALVLARGLSELGVRVRAVCASDALGSRFEAAGAEAAVIPLRRPLDMSGARRVRRFAAGADVIHAQDRRSGLWVRLAPLPSGRPVRVYTVHGLPEPYLPPPVGPRRPGLRGLVAYRGLDAVLCRRVEAVVVPSRAVSELLAERVGFPRERMHVIPNGVELPDAGVARDGALVGSVSVLEPVKGLEVFLHAAAALAGERPGLRFALFGDGSQAAELRALSERLGIAERVHQPGHVPADQALASLAVSVTSSYMENCPMSLLGAMAAGVPVVATAVGGVPEIAPPGTAELVPAGDHEAVRAAIARLLDDPGRAGAQAEAARRRVHERFSAEANAAATLALYERLLDRRA